MEEKINIAKILKNKPEGTKLWTDMFGSVTLYVVTNACDAFQVKHHNKEPWFDEDGKLYKEGVLCIYPSKSMRDWAKFSWKKGDVLVSKDNVYIIFEKFEDDTYTRFKGKHYLWKECNVEDYNKEETKMLTSVFEKATDDVAQTYIKTIEEHLDGKLNLETLEIEKQLEFKDGDIVVYGKSVAICRRIYKHTLSFYVSLTEMFGLLFADEVESSEEYRFATEEEKQQLFSALKKKGKVWDSEHKMIVDLPKNCEFKPFDKVLVRQLETEEWRANIFSHTDKTDEYLDYVCVNGRWEFCIPYEGNEHLLGTTDNFE